VTKLFIFIKIVWGWGKVMCVRVD